MRLIKAILISIVIVLAVGIALGQTTQKKTEPASKPAGKAFKMTARQFIAVAGCKSVNPNAEKFLQAVLDGKVHRSEKPVAKGSADVCFCYHNPDDPEEGILYCKDANGNYQWAGSC
jgi:hypothetical protein